MLTCNSLAAKGDFCRWLAVSIGREDLSTQLSILNNNHVRAKEIEKKLIKWPNTLTENDWVPFPYLPNGSKFMETAIFGNFSTKPTGYYLLNEIWKYYNFKLQHNTKETQKRINDQIGDVWGQLHSGKLEKRCQSCFSI